MKTIRITQKECIFIRRLIRNYIEYLEVIRKGSLTLDSVELKNLEIRRTRRLLKKFEQTDTPNP